MPLNLDIPSPVLPYDRLTNAQRLNYFQGEEELAGRREQAEAQRQAQYGAANLKNLKDTLAELNLGDHLKNEVIFGETQKAYDDLVGQVNIPPTQFDMLVHQRINDLASWEKKFSTDHDFAKTYSDNMIKENSNLDLNEVDKVTKANLLGKYYDVGENGEFIRKPADKINDNQNPVAMLDDPRMQGLLSKESFDVIKKEFQTDKMQDADFSKYASDHGFVNSNSYDIKYNPLLKEVSHDEHGHPTLKDRLEVAQIGGQQLNMLPEATFDEKMSKKNFSSGFYKLWNQQAAVIGKQLAQQGIQLDPHTEKMFQRDFLAKIIKDTGTDLSYIQQKEKTVVPSPPRISVSVNGGSGVAVYPVYGEVDTALSNMEQGGNKWLSVSVLKPIPKNVIVDQANRNLTEGEDKYSAADLQVIRGDDKTLRIFNKKGDFVDYVPQTDADLAGSKNEKERQKILGNNTSPQQPKANNSRPKIDY